MVLFQSILMYFLRKIHSKKQKTKNNNFKTQRTQLFYAKLNTFINIKVMLCVIKRQNIGNRKQFFISNSTLTYCPVNKSIPSNKNTKQ